MIIPPKLQPGDTVQIVAPSTSYLEIPNQDRELGIKRLEELGLKVVLSKHLEEKDIIDSSPLGHRIEDLHDGFANPQVKGVISALGGQNSNELLRYLDYNLIKQNPKIFVDHSDITALHNALFAKTGMVTYSGLGLWAFAEKCYDYSKEYFQKCLFSSEPFSLLSSSEYFDESWDQETQKKGSQKNTGMFVLQEGEAEGTIIGGNLCTLNLLQGTEFFPDLGGSVLFIEDDWESKFYSFNRDLQSLIHQPGFSGVKGIVIGRFQEKSEMTIERLRYIIETKRELAHLPIIANADFGHTFPRITFPIGGRVKMSASNIQATIEILVH